VHPWVVEQRGGERVFFEMARMWPSADLFVLFHREGAIPADLSPRLRTSFLQRLPLPREGYRATLPLLPRAVESLDLSSYDLVISSSSGWAHGVATEADAVHVSYVHSPPRYLWGLPAPTTSGRVAQRVLSPVFDRLRDWDRRAMQRPTRVLANSRTTAGRIHATYGREATVLFPPVDVQHFRALSRQPDGTVVYIGELVPYKRVDRVVRACMMLGVPLRVVGDGPELKALKELAAGADVEFVGRVSEDERDRQLTRASVLAFGGIEDFGIIFVEAMAAGLPIAGIRDGGLAEIAADGGAAFAKEASAEGLAGAIERCLAHPEEIAAAELACRFDTPVFRRALIEHVEGPV
jgi:glycosyltransferase involved in cell wall biosynthesis